MSNRFAPLGLVIIVFVSLMFVKPLLIDIRQSNAQIKATDTQIEKAEAKIKKLEELRPQLSSAQEQINNLKVAMPAAQQIPEVLVMMEAIAGRVGMKITSVEVQPSSNSGNEVGVSLSATGTYDNLFKFTEVLEKNLRPIQIRSLGINSDEGGSISATVSLGVIYQGAEKQQVAPQ